MFYYLMKLSWQLSTLFENLGNWFEDRAIDLNQIEPAWVDEEGWIE